MLTLRPPMPSPSSSRRSSSPGWGQLRIHPPCARAGHDLGQRCKVLAVPAGRIDLNQDLTGLSAFNCFGWSEIETMSLDNPQLPGGPMSGLVAKAVEYMVDVGQRSVLFFDIMRQR